MGDFSGKRMEMNFVFLCNIIRILVFKLYSHPNEPSNFRRGVRAAFMLIPLFGLQLFLTVYRPQNSDTADRIHGAIFMFIIGSQGTIVALLFCFFNAEVMSRLRSSLPCVMMSRPPNDRARFVSTQLTLAEVRHSLSGSLIYHVGTDQSHSPSVHLLAGANPSREAHQPVSACSSLSADDQPTTQRDASSDLSPPPSCYNHV